MPNFKNPCKNAALTIYKNIKNIVGPIQINTEVDMPNFEDTGIARIVTSADKINTATIYLLFISACSTSACFLSPEETNFTITKLKNESSA